MRKLVITLAILFAISSTITLKAEGFKLYGFGDMAYNTSYIVGTDVMSDLGDVFTNNLGAGIQFVSGDLLIFGEVNTFTEMFKIEDMIMFSPTYTEYKVTTGIWYKAVGIEYSHQCNHLIDNTDIFRRGGYSSISINFDTRRLN